jgi:hypothetical protein
VAYLCLRPLDQLRQGIGIGKKMSVKKGNPWDSWIAPTSTTKDLADIEETARVSGTTLDRNGYVIAEHIAAAVVKLLAIGQQLNPLGL